MGSEIEFEWDQANVKHLKRHKVAPEEFEQLILNEPLDLEYEAESGEPRYKSLGATNQGRILIAVWTLRKGKVRAITAYSADRAARKLYVEFGN